MKEAFGTDAIRGLDDLQDMFTQVNKEYMNKRIGKTGKTCGPWHSDTLKELLKLRRAASGNEKLLLSKRIQKESWREIRKYHSNEAHRILDEFKDMNRLEDVHRMPIKAEAKEYCDPEIFADFLERLYDSDEVLEGSHDILLRK